MKKILLLGCVVVIVGSGFFFLRFMPPHSEIQTKSYGEIVTLNVEIRSISLLKSQLHPELIFATIDGTIPDQCSQLKDPVVQRNQELYVVSLQAFKPGDSMCESKPREFEQLIEIDTSSLDPGTYTIQAGSLKKEFLVERTNLELYN